MADRPAGKTRILTAPAEGDAYYQKLTGWERYLGHPETADRVRVAVAALEGLDWADDFSVLGNETAEHRSSALAADLEEAKRILLTYAHSEKAYASTIARLPPGQAQDFIQDQPPDYPSSFWESNMYTVAMTKRVIEEVILKTRLPGSADSAEDEVDAGGSRENPWRAGFSFGRPGGHHSSTHEVTLSYNCGANYVMALAGWLAREQKRIVGVYDMDVHFAGGSHEIIARWAREQPEISQSVYHTDVSAEFFTLREAFGAAALETGHCRIFSTELTKRVRCAPQDDQASQLAAASNKGRCFLDSAALFPFEESFDDTALAHTAIETVRFFKAKRVDCILVSFGLDAEYGELEGPHHVTWLGFWQLGRILRASGLQCVFALEGGGYTDLFGSNAFVGKPLERDIFGNLTEDKRSTLYAQNIRAVARGVRGESLVEDPRVSEGCDAIHKIEALLDEAIAAVDSPDPGDKAEAPGVPLLSPSQIVLLRAEFVRALQHADESLAARIYGAR